MLSGQVLLLLLLGWRTAKESIMYHQLILSHTFVWMYYKPIFKINIFCSANDELSALLD